jgi:hypothetical protein
LVFNHLGGHMDATVNKEVVVTSCAFSYAALWKTSMQTTFKSIDEIKLWIKHQLGRRDLTTEGKS